MEQRQRDIAWKNGGWNGEDMMEATNDGKCQGKVVGREVRGQIAITTEWQDTLRNEVGDTEDEKGAIDNGNCGIGTPAQAPAVDLESIPIVGGPTAPPADGTPRDGDQLKKACVTATAQLVP